MASVETTPGTGEQQLADKNKVYYQDYCIFRMVNGDVKVMTEKAFTTDFLRPLNHQFWKTLDAIQTCAKSKIGCGKFLYTHYFAPLNEDRPISEINYDIKNFPSDQELIVTQNDQLMIKKQCTIICDYISQVNGFEILQMKAEFFKDENDFIWFYYAKDIYMRKNIHRKALSNDDAKKKAHKIQQNRDMAKKQLIKELEQFEKSYKKDKNKSIQNMMDSMNEHYNSLKTKHGLGPDFMEIDKDKGGCRIEDVIRQIRPNCNAKNFKEYLKFEENATQNQKWREMVRSAHAKEDE